MPKPNTQHQQYIPGQPKHNVGAPTRIPSFQSAWIDDTPTPKSSRGGSATSNHTQGLSVAASPQPPPITPGSGSAAFRALRSLLPFGGPGNKNGSNSPAGNASIATPTPIGRTSSFSFGIGRKSMSTTRERNGSLSIVAGNGRPAGVAPVMAIERSKSDSQVDTDVNLRRSISLSRLEVATFLEREPQSNSAPMLRTPSPGLPLSLELSTIIEADSSGVLSRHPASSVTSGEANTTFEIDPETDASLQLSPSNLTSEVLAAINASDSPSVARDWSRAGQAVIIDADAADSQPISPGVDGEQSFTRNLPSGERSFMGERTSDDTSKKHRQASFLPRLRQPSSSHSPRGSPLNTPTSRRFPTPSPTSPRFPNGTPSPVNPRFPTSPPTTPRTQTAPATPHGSPLRPTFPSPRRTTKSFNPPPTSTPAANRHYTSQKTFTPTAVSSLSVATGAKMMGKSSSSGTNFSSDVNDTFASGSSKPPPSNLTSIGKGRPPRKNLQAVLLGRESSSEEVVVYPHTEATPYQQVPRIALSSPPSPTRGTSRTDSNARAPVFTPAGRASLDSRRAPSRPYETPRRPSLDLSKRPATNLETPASGLRRSSFELRRRAPGSLSRSTTSNTVNTLSRSATSNVNPASPSDFTTTPRTSWDGKAGTASTRRGQGTRSQLSPTSTDRRSPAFPPPKGNSPVLRSAASDFRDSRHRKRSMSVQESPDTTPILIRRGSNDARPTSSMSYAEGSNYAQEWVGRAPGRVLRAAGLIDGTSRSNLGSGEDLMGDGGGDATPYGHRQQLYSSQRQEYRSRSGSGSMGPPPLAPSPLAPSPLTGGGPGSANSTGRYGSVRAASEYNPSGSGRAQSRMAFSEAAGPSTSTSRRTSGIFPRADRDRDATVRRERDRDGSIGREREWDAKRDKDMGTRRESYVPTDSPTFTATSSGGRDSRDGLFYTNTTPRSGASTVTAATSISGYLGRDRERLGDRDTVSGRESLIGRETISSRDRDREAQRERERDLKERHAGEMAALLSALSDSQATARLLREENSELRERLGRAAADRTDLELLEKENEDLRAESEELRGDNEDLRLDVEDLKGENEELRRIVGELRHECLERRRGQDELRNQVDGLSLRKSTESRQSLGSSLNANPGRQSGFGSSTSSGASAFWNSSTSKAGGSAPFRFGRELDEDATEVKKEDEDEDAVDWNEALRRSTTPQSSPERGTMIIHDIPNDDGHESDHNDQPFDEDEGEEGDAEGDVLPEYLTSNRSSSLSTGYHHGRRPSTSSSIFPLPPSNMSMLVNEDAHGWDGQSWIASNRSSAHGASVRSKESHTHRRPGSIARNVARERDLRRDAHNISPATANFSMMSGMTGGRGSPTGSYGGRRSPDGSLFLKPEHELFLDEMESMDVEMGAKVEAMKQMKVGPFGFVPAGERDAF